MVIKQILIKNPLNLLNPREYLLAQMSFAVKLRKMYRKPVGTDGW